MKNASANIPWLKVVKAMGFLEYLILIISVQFMTILSLLLKCTPNWKKEIFR